MLLNLHIFMATLRTRYILLDLILNTVFKYNIQVYFHVFIYERSMVLQVNKLLQEHLAMNGILILLKHEIRLEIVLLIKFKIQLNVSYVHSILADVTT